MAKKNTRMNPTDPEDAYKASMEGYYGTGLGSMKDEYKKATPMPNEKIPIDTPLTQMQYIPDEPKKK